MAFNGDGWDRWFPRLVAVVALSVFVFISIHDTTDRPYLLVALVVLITGAPVALLLDAYLRRRNGSGR